MSARGVGATWAGLVLGGALLAAMAWWARDAGRPLVLGQASDGPEARDPSGDPSVCAETSEMRRRLVDALALPPREAPRVDWDPATGTGRWPRSGGGEAAARVRRGTGGTVLVLDAGGELEGARQPSELRDATVIELLRPTERRDRMPTGREALAWRAGRDPWRSEVLDVRAALDAAQGGAFGGSIAAGDVELRAPVWVAAAASAVEPRVGRVVLGVEHAGHARAAVGRGLGRATDRAALEELARCRPGAPPRMRAVVEAGPGPARAGRSSEVRDPGVVLQGSLGPDAAPPWLAPIPSLHHARARLGAPSTARGHDARPPSAHPDDDPADLRSAVSARLSGPTHPIRVGRGAAGVAELWAAALGPGEPVLLVDAPVTLHGPDLRWPTWTVDLRPGGAAQDPWFAAALLGERVVWVRPRDAAGHPWQGALPGAIAADEAEGLRRLEPLRYHPRP